MVVWCTQNLRQDSSSFTWHQPPSSTVITLVEVQNALHEATVTHSELHTTRAQMQGR